MISGKGSYKKLVRDISKSSGYHIYEVEDVLNHLVVNMQQTFTEGKSVKLPGFGTIRIQKMNVKKDVDGKKVCYTTCRLSVVTDEPMMRFLKENYLAEQSDQSDQSTIT